MDLRQSSQYVINSLQLVTKVGTTDLSKVYEEINFFGNIMLPCLSGNIVIRDSVGLIRGLHLQGNEILYVKIKKSNDFDGMIFEKKFRIYKISERNAVNQTSEVYIIHFSSEEFFLSEQQKIKQSFEGTYSSMIETILDKYLKVPFSQATKGGSSFYSAVEETKGLFKIVVPNLTPFGAIEWITKRALNKNGVPDYVFYERTDVGYWFMSLSTLLSLDPIFTIRFGSKNIQKQVGEDIFGARNYKILSQFDSSQKLKSGSYAGKVIAIDPLTRQFDTKIQVPFESTYLSFNHANEYMLHDGFTTNKIGKQFNEMYDSKVVLYPSGLPRRENSYIKQNDSQTSNFVENTSDYLLQRESIFGNFLQRKIRVTLAGNFSLQPGIKVFLDIQKKSTISKDDDLYDDSLRGNYIILGVRHILKYDSHETVIDCATDSSKLAY